ncbi:MAG: AAA family ATPase, partial [Cyanobacteriota bacterium]|nr:AAA family ATPase [Cyanobacteriota bacterium]
MSRNPLPSTLVAELDLLIRSRYPLLYIVAIEEEPVEEVLALVARATLPPRNLLYWDFARGWHDSGSDKGNAMDALGRVGRTPARDGAIFVLKGLHFLLESPLDPRHAPAIRELKNLVRELQRDRKTLIFVSHSLHIPEELQEEVTVIDFPLPTAEEIDALLENALAPSSLNASGLAREQLVKACQGLSRTRIQRVLAKAIAAKGGVNETDIDSILEQKKQVIRQTGILEFFTATESLARVGGLDNLKQWVRMRRDAFTEEARRY